MDVFWNNTSVKIFSWIIGLLTSCSLAFNNNWYVGFPLPHNIVHSRNVDKVSSTPYKLIKAIIILKANAIQSLHSIFSTFHEPYSECKIWLQLSLHTCTLTKVQYNTLPFDEWSRISDCTLHNSETTRQETNVCHMILNAANDSWGSAYLRACWSKHCQEETTKNLRWRNEKKSIPVYHQSNEAPPEEKGNVHLQKQRSFEGHFCLWRAAYQTTSSLNRKWNENNRGLNGCQQ